MKRLWSVLTVMFAAVMLFATPALAGENVGIQLGSGGTFGDIGTVIELQKRGDNKENLVLSSPLSIEINIDNNNSPADQVLFTRGSGANKEIIAILDSDGTLLLKGGVIENAF
ncbi:MAG: hypothetical protein J7647_01510 [Cyanobacteria bacterium SBLK]|nr:hypothetical protein [Cyanobacteria bacterium SBLK]